MKIKVDTLSTLISNYLIRHGIDKPDAIITTNILLEGTLRGYVNHGVDRVLQIKEGFDHGTINTKKDWKIVKENLSTAVIDAHNYLGQPVGDYAMRLAIKKAKTTGIGFVGVLNAGHIGVLSYYSELASNNSCLGIVMSTSSPAVILKGGSIKTLGTNPISYSIPFAPHNFTADFATSKVARGTIIQYLKENKTIPASWAVDKDGMSTDNPKSALEGGIQTIDGDIKGSLLSLLISIMTGHLIGGVINPKVCGTRYMDEKSNKGDLFIAIDIPNLTSLEQFQEQTESLCEFITDQKISFRIPGLRAHEKKIDGFKNGIFINKELMDILEE